MDCVHKEAVQWKMSHEAPGLDGFLFALVGDFLVLFLGPLIEGVLGILFASLQFFG